MKVYIGPYKNWIGPYQLAEKLRYIGIKEDTRDKIGQWLSNTWVEPVCQWIHTKRQRKIKIHIDRYDSWNVNDTLALIILPLLKQFQETKHGSPFIDDEDVPENLRSTAAPPKANEWDIDENHHLRWDWVLSEMIWTFEQLNNDWEDQYWSGESDYIFVKNEEDENYRMEKGPNDTSEFDAEGYDAHRKRIDNGTRLFGKYYMALWD